MKIKETRREEKMKEKRRISRRTEEEMQQKELKVHEAQQKPQRS